MDGGRKKGAGRGARGRYWADRRTATPRARAQAREIFYRMGNGELFLWSSSGSWWEGRPLFLLLLKTQAVAPFRTATMYVNSRCACIVCFHAYAGRSLKDIVSHLCFCFGRLCPWARGLTCAWGPFSCRVWTGCRGWFGPSSPPPHMGANTASTRHMAQRD